MLRWYFGRRSGRQVSAAAAPGDEAVETAASSTGTLYREVPEEFDDACRTLQQTRFCLEVDDGVTVPVVLDDENPSLVLDVTQRLREVRERERASLSPVADFGGDRSWSGAGDW